MKTVKEGDEWESYDKVFLCDECATAYWGLLPDQIKQNGQCRVCGKERIGGKVTL